MSRHRRWAGLEQGNYPCYFECGSVLESKFSGEDFRSWIWFCGYGEKPVHFCPNCLRTRRQQVEDIRSALSERPDGYPAVHAVIPDWIKKKARS